MNVTDIPEIVEMVRKRVEELGRERNVGLKLEEKDYRLEDDWLYLTITPTRVGDRASDYADLMADIEKELREKHIDKVLLIPAIED